MNTSGSEEIEHTADISLHIQATNFAGLLKNAALAMLSMIGMSTDKEGERKRKVEVEGIDREDLLVVWLEELLYLMERYEVGFGTIDIVEASDTNLTATVEEVPDMVPTKEIKAVTYHGLEIVETEEDFEVTIVFDV